MTAKAAAEGSIEWHSLVRGSFKPPSAMNVSRAAVELPNGDRVESGGRWRFDVSGQNVLGNPVAVTVVRNQDLPTTLAPATIGAGYLGAAMVERVIARPE